MTITLAARNAAFARLLAYGIDIHTPNVEAAIEALVEVSRKAKTSITKLPAKRIEAVIFELGMLHTNGNVEAVDHVAVAELITLDNQLIVWVDAYGDGNDDAAWCTVNPDDNDDRGYTLTNVAEYAPLDVAAINADLDREQAERDAAADVVARTAEEPAKAPRKGAHADCTHAPTKVARAACRRARAKA